MEQQIELLNERVKDIDGNIYNTVKIGKQVWLAENLKVTQLNDGTAIPNLPDPNHFSYSNDPAYCINENVQSFKDKYGCLYNWYAVKTGKLAPTGWHVPTEIEWEELEDFLAENGFNYDGTVGGGGEKIAKALATKTDWKIEKSLKGAIGNDLSLNNRSGFSALPGGMRISQGDFWYGSSMCGWWSSTEKWSMDAWQHKLEFDRCCIVNSYIPKESGLFVRCVID
jgi:uncharacterized protein (TIGR02145 family)